MPKPCAIFATCVPMRPRPRTPRVLPRSSVPWNGLRSHFPAARSAEAAGTLRSSASSSAKVCSAALVELAPGAVSTGMPRRVASSRSMLSVPMPARAMTRSFWPFAIRSAVTFVSLRTISATASTRASCSTSGPFPAVSTTSSEGTERSIWMPAADSGSAMTTRSPTEHLTEHAK